MTDLPALKIKSLVNFPANAFGRTGIDVAKQDGAFYIDIDYSHFVPVPVIPATDVPNLYTLVWNVVTGIYELVPLQAVGQLGTFGNTVLVTAPGPINVGTNDGVIAIKKAPPSATAVMLPLAATKQGPIHITDTALNAGTYNITVTPSGAETICGLPQWVLAGDGAWITLFPLAGIGWTT